MPKEPVKSIPVAAPAARVGRRRLAVRVPIDKAMEAISGIPEMAPELGEYEGKYPLIFKLALRMELSSLAKIHVDQRP